MYATMYVTPFCSDQSTRPPLQHTSMSQNEFSPETTLEGHTATVTAVEFSPDGRFLASAGDDGVLLIFSTSSWSSVCRFLDASPVRLLAWHAKKRYLLFCCFQSGDLHILTMLKSMVHPHTSRPQRTTYDSKQEHSVVQTSKFAGCIRSLSLSSTSSRVAIAYGNEVALTDVISNPYRLKDDREYLPMPPTSPHIDPSKSGGPIVESLQFTRKKNRLVVTYAGHGIVYVLALSAGLCSLAILVFGTPRR